MIDILFKIMAIYICGYSLTLILFALGESEAKAPDLKSKLEWGVYFSIVWPMTLPIVIGCMVARVAETLSKLVEKVIPYLTIKFLGANNIIIENETETYPIHMYHVNNVAVVDTDTGMSIDALPNVYTDIFEVSSKNKTITRILGKVGIVECVLQNNTFIVRPVSKENAVFSPSETDYADTFNDYDANMLYSIGTNGLTYENTITEKYRDCFYYHGGFVDRFYFVKSAILNLSKQDYQQFIYRLHKTHLLTKWNPIKWEDRK